MSNKFKYTHWLKIDFRYESRDGKEWKNLKEYADNYDCKISIFYYDYIFASKVIKLECNQSYQELDLDVNSMSDGSLFYLKHKPKNITQYSNKDINYFYNNYVKENKGLEL